MEKTCLIINVVCRFALLYLFAGRIAEIMAWSFMKPLGADAILVGGDALLRIKSAICIYV